MQQIAQILAVTFPFFALVLCGYLAVRLRVLPIAAIPGLSAFVLYFALSSMLFRVGSGTPLAQLINPPLIVVYTLSSLLLIAVVVTMSRNERIGIKDAAFGAMVTIYSNSGFMGIPLLFALLGEKAMSVIIVTLLIDQVLMSPVCIAIAHAERPTGERRGLAAMLLPTLRLLKTAARNPMPWGIAAGVAFGASGWTLPAPVAKTITLLSEAATPVALFTIGTMLARNALRAGRSKPPMDYVPLALTKLFAHPLVMYLGAMAAQALGFPMDAATLTALILVAALPSASFVSMLAESFGADADRIASVITVSTVFSFITFSATVWLLGVQPPT